MIKNTTGSRVEVTFAPNETSEMEVFRDILDCESISFVRVDKGFGCIGYSLQVAEWPKAQNAFNKWARCATAIYDLTTTS